MTLWLSIALQGRRVQRREVMALPPGHTASKPASGRGGDRTLGARLSRTRADPLGNTVLVCRLGCSEELPHQTWVHGLACSTHLALAERGHGVGTQLEDKATTMLGEQRGMPAAAGTVQGDRECRRHLVRVAGGSGELRAGASVLPGV